MDRLPHSKKELFIYYVTHSKKLVYFLNMFDWIKRQSRNVEIYHLGFFSILLNQEAVKVLGKG
jgi:hypothetical protein